MTSRRVRPLNRSFPLIVFLIAIALRLTPVLLTCSLGIGLDDMFQYDMLARSIASGNGYRWYAASDLAMLEPYVDFDLSSTNYDPVHGVETSFRAPLYPSFLALIYFFVGNGANRFFAVRLAQSFLGASLVPLTYFIALRFFSFQQEDESASRTAHLAAWTIAAYPILLIYPIGLVTENLFFPLVLCSFLFLLIAGQKPTILNFLLAGGFLGLAALTRSVILLFAILAILWLWFIVKHRRGAVLTGLAMVLIISPWVVRNSLLHHEPTGIETSMGYNLYLGYHPLGNGSFIFGPSLDLLTIMDDAERDRVGTQKAIEFIQAQPERFLPLVANRLGFFFGLEKRAVMYFYSNDIFGAIPFSLLLAIFLTFTLPFVIVSLSAAMGPSFIRWDASAVLLAFLFVSYLLPHVLILSEDRFHLMLIPFFAILASRTWTGGLPGLAVLWKSSSHGKALLLFAILVMTLLLLNWGLELLRDADKLAQLFGPNGNHAAFPY